MRVLNVSETTVTDRDLHYLKDLTELRMLYLEKCKLDVKKVEDFKEDMDGLAVYY